MLGALSSFVLAIFESQLVFILLRTLPSTFAKFAVSLALILAGTLICFFANRARTGVMPVLSAERLSIVVVFSSVLWLIHALLQMIPV